MAYKLDTGSYDFGSLEKKYSEFRAPSFKILVDGKDIVQKDKVGISEVIVENCADKSDMASFKVINAYVPSKMQFLWQSDYFTLGKKLEVKCGYMGKDTSIFEGYITNVQFEYTDTHGAVVTVEGLDASFLMMKGQKSAIWSKKKHSAIVEEIGKAYKLKTEVDSTDIEFETVVQSGQNDYQFIERLAMLNSCEFFIAGGTLYFRKYNKSKSPALSLELGKTLLEFTYGANIEEQITGVTVRGYNIKKEEIEVSVTSISAKSGDGDTGVDLLGSIDSKNTVHYIFAPIISQAEAKSIGEAYLMKKSMEFVTGEGVSVGLPEICGGRYVKIKGMFGTKAKNFYVVGATHIVSGDGYTTYFRLGGNCI